MDLNKLDLSALWNTILTWSPKIVGGILVLILGFWIAGFITKLVSNALKRSKVDDDLTPFLSSLVSVLLKILVVLTAASVVGIQITAFVALLGGLAIGVGAGLSGSLGHFASGIMLMVFKPYRVNDIVTIGDFTGFVKEIGIFETVILTFENKRIHIPNGNVTSGPITNISGEGKMRADMNFTVDSGEDFDKVRAAIIAVAERSDLILKNPGVQVHFKTDDMDKHVIDVWPWCDPKDYFDAFYYMQEEVRKEFKGRSIKGNVPDMNVHIIQN